MWKGDKLCQMSGQAICFQFGTEDEFGKDKPEEWVLQHNHAGQLLVQKFDPSGICMVSETGRVYHPGPRLCGDIGLISDRYKNIFIFYMVRDFNICFSSMASN